MNIPEGYEEIDVSHPDFKELHQSGEVKELCRCGGFIEEHQPSIAARKHGVIVPGHGQCAERHCPQFTWTAFVRKVD
jgi:hypothetical protein